MSFIIKTVYHSSGVVPSFHIPIVGKSDRCQLAVLQGMLHTPDDDGGTDDNPVSYTHLKLIEVRGDI